MLSMTQIRIVKQRIIVSPKEVGRQDRELDSEANCKRERGRMGMGKPVLSMHLWHLTLSVFSVPLESGSSSRFDSGVYQISEKSN